MSPPHDFLAIPAIDTLAQNIPAQAIAHFEEGSGLRVCLHDWNGAFHPFLPARYHWHSGPLCSIVKRGPHGHRCRALEGISLRQSALLFPEGRIHQCHAGLIEWVVPLLHGDKLLGMLFAGQRTAHPSLQPDHRDRPSPVQLQDRPPPVTDQEAQRCLEGLRQLAARLVLWHGGRRTAAVAQSRRGRILHFIERRHSSDITLADLARHLSLSEGRAAHLVKELTHESWQKLLTRARLRSACLLLRHSDASIADIAQQCGFGDQSSLHRAFRRHFHTTPARYRRHARLESESESSPSNA